jgi:amino acid adenylation domain-containing protein/non-ribosomal peptide synthase protein (TIGR01720 family)
MHSDPPENKFRLSQPQQRIWNIEKIYPETAIYCIGGVSVFENGNMDLGILKEAFIHLLKKRKSFNLKIVEIGGDPWQYFDEESKILSPDELDFTRFEDPYQVFYEWATGVFAKPFTITGASLYYIAVVRITENKKAFLLKFHHLISDGWSVALSIDEVFENYKKISAGENEKEPGDYSYRQFIEYENNYFNSSDFQKDKQFWYNRFHGFDHHSVKRTPRGLNGARRGFVIDQTLSESIKNYVERNRITLNIFFISVIIIWEYRRLGKEDLIIGVPLLNRNSKEQRRTIGMYTSTMPFRIHISEDITVNELFAFVQQELKTCYKHQRYPYNYLIKDLELRKKEIDRLFSICVNYYSTNLPDAFQRESINNLEFYSGYQLYDLQLCIKEWGGSNEIQLQFDYNNEVYNRAEIEFLYEIVNNLAGEFCTDDRKQLRDVELLTPLHKANIDLCFNKKMASPEAESVLDHWRHHCVFSGDRFLFDEDGKNMSHGDFYQKSIRMAICLKELNVGKGDRVCVIMHHSVEYINSIISVLLLGAVFVPIDPQSPLERIKFIIEDTKTNLVITDAVFFTTISDLLKIKVLFVRDIKLDDPVTVSGFPKIFGIDLAYIIYTSGTTGKPKGVAISHGNLVNYTKWAAEMYCKSKDDVFAFFTSIGFDLTITSIFVPLITGARIKIYSSDANDTGHILHKVFSSKDVNLIKVTPSHLSVLDRSSEISLNKNMRLIVGGEDFRVDLAKKILDLYEGEVEIFNEYGPTEATVGCMIHKFDPEKDLSISVPIGKPINNTLIYLLDDKLRHVPMGCVGQIYIGGNSVSGGYWNNPEMSAEKFSKDLFDKSTFYYKTGDLGKFIDAYTVSYEGRVDDQIKINGYRVELKEVESVIKVHEAIKDATVVPFGGNSDFRPGTSGKLVLVAYLIVKDFYSEDVLKVYLDEKLPGYMIPAHFVLLSTFPLNKNGKLDKDKLPFPKQSSTNAVQDFPVSESAIILLSAIKELLAIDDIELQDNFFSIGGDSISAIQLSAKLKNNKLTIAVQDILRTPILGEMAKKIQSAYYQKTPIKLFEDNGLLKKDSHFTTPAIEWFFNQKFAVPEYYNQSLLLEFQMSINKSILNEIFQTLVTCHDSLRINAFYDLQKIGCVPELISRAVEVQEYKLNDQESFEKQVADIGKGLKSSIRFKGDLLFKVALIKDGSYRSWVLLTFHHFIIDGVSWQIILSDFQRLLGRVKDRLPLVLEKPSCQWSDWSNSLMGLKSYPPTQLERERIDFIRSCTEKSYYIRTKADVYSPAESINCVIDLSEWQKTIRETKDTYRVTINELLLVLFILTWQKVSNDNNILVEVEKHGRDSFGDDKLNIDRTVGWFTIFDLFFVNVSSGKFPDQIVHLKDQIRKPLFDAYRYSVLKDVMKQMPDMSSMIRFNYLGNFTFADNQFFKVSEIGTGDDIHPDNGATCKLEFNCWMRGSRLFVQVNYNSGILDRQKTDQFLELFKELFTNVLINSLPIPGEYISYSDFEQSDLSKEEFDNLFS